MKKIVFLIFCAGCIAVFFTGCAKRESEETTGDSARETAAYMDADITIPAGLVGNEMSEGQEFQKEEGSANVTFSLSGEQRTEIVAQIQKDLEGSIAAILSDKDRYPDIVSITPGPGCKEFEISLKEGMMNSYEGMLAMSFYMVGDKYQIYDGVPAGEAVTIVRYVDADTGEVISETDSTTMDTQ